MSKIFITTAIDYVNSLPHIGTAYEKIGADVLARFYRMQGHDVLFQMGNDEHSANVQKAAEAKGLTPKQYCDEMLPQFKDIWKKLNISYDQFIQTSDKERHYPMVLEFFKRVCDKGDIYEKDYEGWYCESCEAFYLEKDLEEGLCKNHKTKPKWLKEKNYFFRLSKPEYVAGLMTHIHSNPDFIVPTKRKNEVMNFIEQGLQDFSISRSTFTWGIPVPLNPKHVFYVWFDALINYLSLLNLKSLDDLKNNDYWKNTIHIVGKDITRFHCIIWPSMLMSADLPLPKTIFGHGFVYLKGEKMSKSLGNVVTPLDVLNKYPDFGADALRYYLMRGSSFGDDGDFTWDNFIERYNADLANGLGNLASRILGMVWKYQEGKVDLSLVHETPDHLTSPNAKQACDELLNYFDINRKGDFNSHQALECIWSYITRIDEYIDRQAPWTLAKTKNSTDLAIVLTNCVLAVKHVCVLIKPFIPQAGEKIWNAYGFDKSKKYSDIIFDDLDDLETKLTSPHILSAQKLNLFPRIEIMKEETTNGNVKEVSSPKGVEGEAPRALPVEGATLAPVIDIKEFGKVDLRVAKVLEASKVEGADKLLLLQVELGAEKRQIVSGIAQYFKPEDLIGKRIIVVANLKPAKIRGIESYGMLLAAKEEGRLVLATTDGEIASNAKVG